MGIAMLADFKVLKDMGNGVYFPQDKEDAFGVTIGAFSFVIDGKTILFDWDACSGDLRGGVFRFETGCGPFFNSYELADYYDDELAEMGLKREDLTPEYLASTSFIEEFHVNFDDEEGHEVSLGWHEDNAGAPGLKVELLSVGFVNTESGIVRFVAPKVLENYNKGLTREQVLNAGQIEVTEQEMEQIANRAAGRLKAAAREDMSDLYAQIQFAEDIRKAPVKKSEPKNLDEPSL